MFSLFIFFMELNLRTFHLLLYGVGGVSPFELSWSGKVGGVIRHFLLRRKRQLGCLFLLASLSYSPLIYKKVCLPFTMFSLYFCTFLTRARASVVLLYCGVSSSSALKRNRGARASRLS